MLMVPIFTVGVTGAAAELGAAGKPVAELLVWARAVSEKANNAAIKKCTSLFVMGYLEFPGKLFCGNEFDFSHLHGQELFLSLVT
jgi:hypothetical protein